MNLSANEARVLGSLIEKEITTPDNYPLSLNSLINACNQKSNRHPVMTLDERAAREALDGLNQQNLAGTASGADSRVTKYEHRVHDALKLGRREIAILCELLIRGPQTPGELRGRVERMHRFEDTQDVLSTLHRLMEWNPPLAVMLPRQPGTKESRYAHLMSGEPEMGPIQETTSTASVPAHDTLDPLRRELEQLRGEVAELRSRISALESR